MTRRDLPNLITGLRILLVVPIVLLLLHERYTAALLVFGVAGFSDALDGYLAKRYGWHSRLGSLLDPLADKLLMVSCYLVLGSLSLLPRWLVAAVIARDLVIVGGAVTYHFTFGPFEARPTWLSKLNTLFQGVLILAVVVDRGLFVLPGYLLEALVWVVLATTVSSGLIYVWDWSSRARRAVRRPDHV